VIHCRRVRSARLLLVPAAAAALLLSGCGGREAGPSGSAAPSQTPSTSVTPSPTPAADPNEVSGLFDIGGGRHLYAECDGTGSPTILLEAGDEDGAASWDTVYSDLVAQTRTCRYDRLSNGDSAPATGCRKAEDLRHDTEALLSALKLSGPFLLVGHSGGGFLMANYAYAHADQVSGLVLVETPHAIIPARESPELIEALACEADTNIEHRDYVQVENYAWSHRHRLGRIPMTVISNDYGLGGEGEEQRHNVPEQRGWLVLSPLAHQVVVTSGHDVPQNEPDLVVHEILKVLNAIRR
jgi:hypothetical protein